MTSSPTRHRFDAVSAFGLVVLLAVASGAVPAHGTERVSVASDGTQSNGFQGNGYGSFASAISGDGRFVAFRSFANNLVPGDTNLVCCDVFVHDRQTGVTERVSVASNGTQSNGQGEGDIAISADGRFVAFGSEATSLVPGDTNGRPDVFVRDRQTGTTERVSVASNGTQANGYGAPPLAISADGRFVAFRSFATNLVPGDTNGLDDVFVHDRQTGMTERVNVASDGAQANAGGGSGSISADGRFVAFTSFATNLVPGDTNAVGDVFVHDRQTGMTERVSVVSDGTEGNDSSGDDSVAISADGQFVAFDSNATNLVPNDTNETRDIFVQATMSPSTTTSTSPSTSSSSSTSSTTTTMSPTTTPTSTSTTTTTSTATTSTTTTTIAVGTTTTITTSTTTTLARPICGNGRLEAGEACDEGNANGSPASCCTQSCAMRPTKTPCDNGSTCSGTDYCDAGVCEEGIQCSGISVPGTLLAGRSARLVVNVGLADTAGKGKSKAVVAGYVDGGGPGTLTPDPTPRATGGLVTKRITRTLTKRNKFRSSVILRLNRAGKNALKSAGPGGLPVQIVVTLTDRTGRVTTLDLPRRWAP